MQCHDIEQRLTSWLLGDLTETEAAEVKQHVQQCDDCRAAMREIEPTLDLLRTALAAPSSAPARLSPAHRRRIGSYGIQTADVPRRRKVIQWITLSHPRYAYAAALLLIGFFVLSALLMPAASFSRSHARRGSELGVKRELLKGRTEKLEEYLIAGALSDGAPDASYGVEMEEIQMLVEPPAPQYDDTVTGTRSPVVLRGIYGSRSPGVRGQALAKNLTKADAAGDWRARDESPFPAAVPAPEAPPPASPAAQPWSQEGWTHVAGVPQGGEGKDGPIGQGPSTDAGQSQRDVGVDAEIGRGPELHSRTINGPTLSNGGAPPKPKLTKLLREKDSASALGLVAQESCVSNNDLVREDDRVALKSSLAANSDKASLCKDEKKKGKDKEEQQTGPRFRAYGVNPFVTTEAQPFSTFSIDVDTAAFTLARNYMRRGYLPPAESVRTEEFVNFFDYQYPAPDAGVFKIYAAAAPSPFGRGLHMLKIGVKGLRLGREEQRTAVLTFLIDTSGSMNQPDRLGLVKKSLRLLVGQLAPQDRVAIVQYDSHARLLLEHTPASRNEAIEAAIDQLQCGGSTNLEEGMRRAYELAARAFISGAENRVLLLSDGVANLGTLAAEDILASVSAYRKQGITCSVFGFGIGTYDDTMLEVLANKGDGAYVFIDSEEEARRVMVDDLAATLNTIATDVKIQVEFNPRRVTSYRQLGYENRQLKKEDFRNDAVDAGEVGSGQSVTALYELELEGADRAQPLATVRVRFRRVDTGAVEEIERAITENDLAPSFEAADARFRLAACAAEFAEILRGTPFAAGSEFQDVATRLRPVLLDLPLDHDVRNLLHLIESATGMSRGEL